MIKLSEQVKTEMYAEAQKCYPFEACGALLGSGDRNAQKFVAFKNRQNEVHQKDPARYPRDAKTAYTIDSKEWQQTEKSAQAAGLEIVAIFHSHPEHGVYFSQEDKEMAAPWGEPLFPNQSYIVVSVYEGAVKNASEFIWSTEKKDFVEEKIL